MSFSQIPEERIARKGHAVDVVEAENRAFYKPREGKLTAAEQREKELLETEAFENLHINDNEEEEDERSSGNLTYRVSEGRTGTVPVVSSKEQQGLPRWDTRWPIDVWVSCGEPFVPLEGMFRDCHQRLCEAYKQPPRNAEYLPPSIQTSVNLWPCLLKTYHF